MIAVSMMGMMLLIVNSGRTTVEGIAKSLYLLQMAKQLSEAECAMT